MSALEFAVLKSAAEAAEAEHSLVERRLVDQVPDGPGVRLRRKLGLSAPSKTLIPDPRKSWDVHRALEAILQRCSADDAVLDIGSLGSRWMRADDPIVPVFLIAVPMGLTFGAILLCIAIWVLPYEAKYERRDGREPV